MEAEYSAREASVSSCIRDYSESTFFQIFNVLSPEDIAWADSCLINHPEHLNGDWNSVRYALLEIFDNQPSSLVSSLGRDNMRVVPTMEMTSTEEFVDGCCVASRCEEAGKFEYSFAAENEADVFLSQILEGNDSENYMQHSIQPNHSDVIEAKTMNEAYALSSRAKESFSEASSMQDAIMQKDNLGHAEDLETQIKEEGRDEFMERLKKVLAAISVHSLPSTRWDSVRLRDASTLGDSDRFRDASLDDVTARIQCLFNE